jgi:putative ABC transport system ATP-binding protein
MQTTTPIHDIQLADLAAGDAAVQVRDAVRVFGRGDGAVRALEGVTLAFERGTFTAVMGPSGSGKSTLLQNAAGLDRLTRGQVVLAGHDLGELGERALARLRRERMGFVFQSFNLVPTLTAEENVALAAEYAGTSGSAARVAARASLASVGLAERAGHRPMELSGGEQQRVAIARALVNDPKLILGDEPTGNLDSSRAAEVLGLLRRFNRERGQTVLIVTHDQEVGAACDRIIRMRDGRIIADERVADVQVAA